MDPDPAESWIRDRIHSPTFMFWPSSLTCRTCWYRYHIPSVEEETSLFPTSFWLDLLMTPYSGALLIPCSGPP